LINSLDKFGIREFYPTKENGLEWFANWDDDRTVHRNSFDPYDYRFGLGSGTGLIIGDGKKKHRINPLQDLPRGVYLAAFHRLEVPH
jgi:hypothetical protein